MTMGEEFGQHFTYLFARLGAAGETPEAEGRETGRAIWCTGTGVTLRLAANRDQLVRQVAGEAVIEVGHQGRFIGALRGLRGDSGGIGTLPDLLVVAQLGGFAEPLVDTVVREARQPYEHLVDVARRPGGGASGVVARLVVIVETLEENSERGFGVSVGVEDAAVIADEEHGNYLTGHMPVQLAAALAAVWNIVAHFAEEPAELGGEGTEPVRHAVYHSRAWPGEALRPEAGECLVKRVKQTTDLMAVALRTGYVGEQVIKRCVDVIKLSCVALLGRREQGTFVALTLPVLPPDLTADVLVERREEILERGGQCSEHSALHVP
ncbi:WD G-beta repeat domain containing protein, putative [Babesia ovata]|uniref:WD G-beta repeat domain containing protein, putative n=1 Tax=Babesia ovata TaxID=189622 RepID=A0A2H6KJ24_9APIC|nr:WD G-beta repeat domain containing protein, putative [Babesia ovata]GBE62979.1 WD G-beta repeat domain containing protein, putative [Babesia ovata]